MTEELELFCEDMHDQLAIMESTLVDMSELDIKDINSEMINNLFRAMHTMKGNASMFGFDELISFAHLGENLLDEIRNSNIVLTEDIIDLFLKINDFSNFFVFATVKNEKLNNEQTEQLNDLKKSLSSYLEVNNDKADDVQSISSDDLEDENNSYIIHVKLKEDFFISGMDFISIHNYLNLIGNIKSTVIIDDNIPSILEINSLKAYISMEIHFECDEPVLEIIEAFEFVKEDIELNIVNFNEVDEQVNEVENIENVPRSNETPVVAVEELNKKINTKKKFSLRVDSTKVDTLIKQISEMVIANAKIIQYAKDKNDSDFEEVVLEMSEILDEVRDGIMNIRMVQVGDSFNKLRRIVKDTAKKTNKEINFNIYGEQTELDKTVVEKIMDPLVHMLRNSVDHGIERPEVRKKLNKDPIGNITLSAYPDSGNIIIEIKDDGAGLNKEVLYKKAIEKGLISSTSALSQTEIYNLIFMPGFSTANVVSNISGRGVGMDVVKNNIEELRGSVNIDSELGFGTTITVRLPLTLAIIDGFLVKVFDTKYIIPLNTIQECLELDRHTKNNMKDNNYMTLRDEILPLLDMRKHFNEKDIKHKRENIVVVKYANYRVGLIVDELYGELQTVIKPLGEIFKNVIGISGGTILGSGDIALIFDIPKLINYKIKMKEKI